MEKMLLRIFRPLLPEQPVSHSFCILFSHLHIIGVDISDSTLPLAKLNLQYNIEKQHRPESAQREVSILKGDVLNQPTTFILEESIIDGKRNTWDWDVLISLIAMRAMIGYTKYSISHA